MFISTNKTIQKRYKENENKLKTQYGYKVLEGATDQGYLERLDDELIIIFDTAYSKSTTLPFIGSEA